MSATVPLAEYLFTRLQQLGVESIHGVPGDYNLPLLDYVEPQGLRWVGNCNELNAGYAADAYSRVKGLGAIITTFGVGELSAANAIAGAYCELAPVVHIVGTPARHLQEARALIHHTFNDGNYGQFAEMARHITVAQASLSDPRTCPQLIDEAIQQCLVHSRPVYIQVPVDMVSLAVDAGPLKTKIELPAQVPSKDEEAAVALVLDRMYTSKQPMILVDGEVRGYGILDELHKLIEITEWPTWITIFGKSCVDEPLPNFHGIWQGDWANAEDSKYIKSSDLVLCFGPHFSNTNSYSYTAVPNSAATIFFTSTTVKTGDRAAFRDLPARMFLKALLKRLESSKIPKPTAVPATMNGPLASPSLQSEDAITQEHFYKTFNPVLRPGDVILGETGTAGHGVREFKLPPGTHLFKPSTWLSIGYMLPAAQGAALAQRELSTAGKWQKGQQPPRTVLLMGDGSFQMTAQELSTIIKLKLNLLLVLINNDGYTIERCLHGYDQRYNDIAYWDYLKAPALFGAREEQKSGYAAVTSKVRTWGELKKELDAIDAEGRKGEPMLRMMEVVMDSEDAPASLSRLLQNQKDAAAKKVNGA